MKLAEGLHVFPWTQTQANNCNAYLVGLGKTMLIDPGHARLFQHVEMGLSRDGVSVIPQVVLVTHCHPDHLEAGIALQRAGLKLAMHADEIAYLEGEGKQLGASLGLTMPEFTCDFFLDEGELTLGDESFQVLLTPGHSPGHICLYWPRLKALIAGDLIFAQGVGRVDFPGGSAEQLQASVLRMETLDLEWLLPGHGPVIKGKDNIAKNFALIKKSYFGMR
jgi:glyoxylase-like metal-dependent hydrolase (beta-lactamase superfamily II)